MKRTLKNKWLIDFRDRYPGLRRAVMMQRATRAIKRHYWIKVAPERFKNNLPVINPLVPIMINFSIRQSKKDFKKIMTT